MLRMRSKHTAPRTNRESLHQRLKWGRRIFEAERYHQDPTKQLQEREILIYFLESTKCKLSDFQMRIEDAAELYLQDQGVNLNMLRKQVKKTKKERDSLNSNKYIDMLIEYLRASDSSLGNHFLYRERYIEEISKYVSGDKRKLLKKMTWKRINSGSEFIEGILSHSHQFYSYSDQDENIREFLIENYLWNGNQYLYQYIWRDGKLFQTIDGHELLEMYRFMLLDKDSSKETLSKRLRGMLDEFVRKFSEDDGDSFPSHFLDYGGSRRALQSYIEIGVVDIQELEPNLHLLDNLEIEPVIGDWMNAYVPFTHVVNSRVNIEVVLDAFGDLDESIVTRDGKTNSYPFMQVVENESSSTLDVIYYLLRRNPKPIIDAVQCADLSQNEQVTVTFDDDSQQSPILNGGNSTKVMTEMTSDQTESSIIKRLQDQIQSLELQISKQTEEIAKKDEELLEHKDKIKQQARKITKYEEEIGILRKESESFMSVELLQEETKCCLCYNKFSTDIKSTQVEIRRFLPVLSRAACPHYFCQGCIENTQLAAAENEPRKQIPKWLKCPICKRKTAFCPENPNYHLKLMELLRRAERNHGINVKIEVNDISDDGEADESGANVKAEFEEDTSTNHVDENEAKRAKFSHVTIKQEQDAE